MNTKLMSILVVLALTVSLFAASTVYVAADNSFGTVSVKGHNGEVKISSIDELNRYLSDSAGKCDSIDIDLLGEKHCLSKPVIISGNSLSMNIKNGSLDMENKNRAFELTGNGSITLNLGSIAIQNCRSNNGGAMKIDAPNCTVKGGNFVNCMTSDKGSNGGAINIASKGTDCTVEKTVFSMCYAYGGKGGAIYSAADRTKVRNCRFSEVDAGKGKCIYFDAAGWSQSENTLPPWTSDCIGSSDANTASVLSGGSLWIIIVIAVIAAGSVMTIVVKKRRSAENR